MLPSNFKRSDTFNLLRDQMRSEMNEMSTAGPADYNIQRVIGKKHISQAQIKACPQYSFNRTMTHRTIDTHRSKSAVRERKKSKSAEQNAVALESGSMCPSRFTMSGAAGNDLKIYHKTNFQQNPGVGDYNIDKASINMRNKSPKATIGK